MGNSHVLLMDATIATGAAAMMAIRVLLDHDVPQENIMFLSLIAAPSGKSDLKTMNRKFFKYQKYQYTCRCVS